MAACSWNQISWSFGGEIWDSSTFRVDGILQSPSNVAALDMARDLIASGPPGSLDTEFSALLDNMCNGKAAMGSIWATFMPCVSDPSCCALADKIGYSVIPGQTEHSLTLGGMGLHVNRQLDPSRTQLALQFLRWFSSQDAQRAWVRIGGYTARKSVLASGTFINSAAYAPVLAVSYPLVKDFWNIPEYSELLRVQMKYLGLAFNGSLSSFDALSLTAREQQQILDAAYPDGPPLPLNMRQVLPIEGVVIALLCLVGAVLVAALLLMAWIVRYRAFLLYRISSPLFLVLILLGVVLALGGLLTYARLTPDVASCNFHLWLTVLGVTLMMAPLLAKTWRILQFYRNARHFKRVDISNSTVLGWLLMVASPVVVLLVVWTAVDTNGPTRDNDVAAREYTVTCDNAHLPIYLGVLFGYLGALFVGAAVVSFYVRHLSNRVSEAKYVALFIYNAILISVVFLPLIFYLSHNPTVKLALEIGALLFFIVTFLLLMFAPKLYMHYKGLADGPEATAALQDSLRRKTGSDETPHSAHSNK